MGRLTAGVNAHAAMARARDNRARIRRRDAVRRLERASPELRLLDDFFDFGDLLLDFPGDFFDDAVRFEIGIVSEMAYAALDGALYFVEGSFGFVFGTVLHRGVASGQRNIKQ
jgi:hypothetical protein